jgi:MFS family permease
MTSRRSRSRCRRSRKTSTSTSPTAQWTINAYALVFGVFTVTGGRLADLLGRRRIFVVGATIFAVCSLIGALAPNVAVLIGARAVMGIGGAMMWPGDAG